jgi:hypothetical protein
MTPFDKLEKVTELVSENNAHFLFFPLGLAYQFLSFTSFNAPSL